MAPRFSILVPTRNRPLHLRSCLDSIWWQTFADYEVIVQDNSDSPRSFDAGPQEPGVAKWGQYRYQFNRKVLSMAANWDAAFERATGEYVLFVGDDDALYPRCLEAADRLLRAGDLDALHWHQSIFFWPDHGDEGRRGLVEVPRGRGFFAKRPWPEAYEVLRGGLHYGHTQMTYSGCVRKSVLERIKFQGGGKLFPTRFPDLYSGLAVCATAKRAGWLGAPLAVSGSSRTTAGGNMLSGLDNEVTREFKELADRDGRHWHGDVPHGDQNLLAAMLLDSYLWIRDLVGWPGGFPRFAEATPAAPEIGFMAPGDVVRSELFPEGIRTAAEAARFCDWFTSGGISPEVLIEELREEVVRAVRTGGGTS